MAKALVVWCRRKGFLVKRLLALRIQFALLGIGIFFLGIAGTPLPTQAGARLADQMTEKLSPFLPRNADWALVVVDMATGKEIIRTGTAANKPMVSGSLVKLLISGALLDYVAGHGKPDMRTTLSSDGPIDMHELLGNLYLTGRGDALVSSDAMRSMVRKLSRQGVKKITGDLIADATIFDAKGLERKRKGTAYASPGALGLDLHTVAITVFPTQAGQPPEVSFEPINSAVRVAMEARTVDSAANTIRIVKLDDLSFRIAGNIAIAAGPFKQRVALNEPALYAGGTLRSMLKESNISLAGKLRSGQTPASATQLAEVQPPDVDVLLRDMNMNSLNVVADNLLLVLGSQRFDSPGTREKGLRAVVEFLGRLGLAADETRVADGSGLHDENRITASLIANYLQVAAAQPWFRTLYASLPRAGMDGTLLGLEFVDERFRAKTGILEDAYALAGYGVDRGARKFSFSFIVNHPGIGAMNMERAGAAVMRHLSTEVLL